MIRMSEPSRCLCAPGLTVGMRSALLMMVVTYPAQLRARSRVMQEGHAMARQVASLNSGTVSRILQAQSLTHFFAAARGTRE